MGYNEKMQIIRSIIDEHNKSVTTTNQVDFDSFLSCLQSMGGTTDDAIKQCDWMDFSDCGLPRLIAKQAISKISEPKERVQSTFNHDPVSYISREKSLQMSVAELLSVYDPFDIDNEVGRRLRQKSKGLPFLVFLDDYSVDIPISSAILEEVVKGYPSREIASRSDGVPCRVYRIGEQPEAFADENPIYPGHILRPGGICDQTEMSWSNISMKSRQIIRVALESGEIRIESLQDAYDLMDFLVNYPSDDLESVLLRRFKKSAITLIEMMQVGRAPILRLPLGENSNES